MDYCLSILRQIKLVSIVILPAFVGFLQPFISLTRVEGYQSIVGLGLVLGVFVAGHLIVTVLQVPFDHINGLGQCINCLLFVSDCILQMPIVSIELVVQQNWRDQAFLQNFQPLLNLADTIIIIFLLFMLLSDPCLDLGQQHSYII